MTASAYAVDYLFYIAPMVFPIERFTSAIHQHLLSVIDVLFIMWFCL